MTPARPGVRVMIKNLALTAKNVIADSVNGLPILSDEQLTKSRVDICQSCSLFDKQQFRCSSCGCYMKAKVQLQSAKCPIGKW